MYENAEIEAILQSVKDPEIPVISILELGIVRNYKITDQGVHVNLTPTYSGCPAMDVIPVMVKEALQKAGFSNITVENLISPPWTTDWITEEGHEKLRAFGIAPPVETTTDASFLSGAPKVVPCPFCHSTKTRLISQFGSTPCKSAYQCNECLEPFDYFKCH